MESLPRKSFFFLLKIAQRNEILCENIFFSLKLLLTLYEREVEILMMKIWIKIM